MNYVDFASIAATLVSNLRKTVVDKVRPPRVCCGSARSTHWFQNFAQQFKQADVATINGMNRGEFTSRLRVRVTIAIGSWLANHFLILQEALQNVDVEGNGLGSRQDVATVLSEDLGLSAKQVRAVVSDLSLLASCCSNVLGRSCSAHGQHPRWRH